MKISIIILLILIVALIAVLFSFQKTTKTAVAPQLINGILSNCPDKPNCVCSEYKDDFSHHIDPIGITEDSAVDNLILLKNSITEMGGEIQIEKPDYLAATFTSSVFRFVDDLEIRIDSADGFIHFRSASRVGYSDLGANKKRVELLKESFKAKLLKAN